MKQFSIGEKIEKIRKESKLSRRELSEIVGISEISLFRYEKGDRDIPTNIVRRLTAALNYNFLAGAYLDREYGKRIQQFRESKNMTISDLSKATQIPIQFLFAYEEGEKDIPYEYVYTIANTLGVTIDDMINSDTVDDKPELNLTTAQKEKLELIKQFFCNLNADGQSKAVERMEELTLISKYTEPDQTETISKSSE